MPGQPIQPAQHLGNGQRIGAGQRKVVWAACALCTKAFNRGRGAHSCCACWQGAAIGQTETNGAHDIRVPHTDQQNQLDQHFEMGAAVSSSATSRAAGSTCSNTNTPATIPFVQKSWRSLQSGFIRGSYFQFLRDGRDYSKRIAMGARLTKQTRREFVFKTRQLASSGVFFRRHRRRLT